MEIFTINRYTDRVEKYKKNENSITAMLLKYLHEIDIFKQQKPFIESLGISENYYPNERNWSQLRYGDYYGSILHYINWKTFLSNIRKSLENNPYKDKDINDNLADILNSADIYLNTSAPATRSKWVSDHFSEYDQAEIEKLRSFYELKKYCYDLAYNIYLLFFLAANKKLPDNFMFGPLYETALQEFNDKVTKKFGISSKPSIRAIMLLSEGEKPNVFALHERADLYYYGNAHGIKKDISKAFDYYEIAAGLEKAPDSDDYTICHPLSVWSLAFILLNYHRKGTPLEHCDTIQKIEDRYGDNLAARIEQALVYAKIAKTMTDSDDGGLADNIYGKVAILTENDCPGIEEIKKEFNMKTSEEYLIDSADQGYIYAINNLAMYEIDRMWTDPDNRDKHLSKALDYLKRGSALLSPFALNILGKIYLERKVWRKEHILFGKQIESLDVNINMPSEALNCFKKAAEYFLDSDSAWAIRNMLLLMPEHFKEHPDEVHKYIKMIDSIDEQKADEPRNDVKNSLQSIYGIDYDECLS